MTRRILLSYLSLTLFVLLALEVPLGVIYAHHERDGFAADIERDAVVMAEQAEQAITEGRPAPIAALAQQYAQDTGAEVLVVNTTGKVLASTGPTDPAGDAALAAALANQHAIGYRGSADGGSQLYVVVPARTGATVSGAVRITYGTDLVDASATRAWFGLALGGLLTLGVVALTGFVLARGITRPVRALEEAAAVIGEQAAAVLPTDVGPPELRRLAVRLADTSQRLHRLVGAQRSFAAVASHQLRSPLTALRLRLENLEPEVGADGRGELAAAIAEVERLTRMVQGLLALARLEDGAGQRQPADLDAVIDDRVDTWGAYAAEHDVGIVRSPGDSGLVWAVPGAVEQIIDNLLENAVRVAPPHSTITVGAGPATGIADTVELHVVDHGPGMDAADRARAFDRFWRAPDATGDGSGLGLAIVRQLARAGGGDAELRPAPGGGIDATVRLRQSSTHPGEAR